MEKEKDNTAMDADAKKVETTEVVIGGQTYRAPILPDFGLDDVFAAEIIDGTMHLYDILHTFPEDIRALVGCKLLAKNQTLLLLSKFACDLSVKGGPLGLLCLLVTLVGRLKDGGGK